MNAEDHFSRDYQEARSRFLAACKAAGAALVSIEHPLKGPDGKPLFTDVARLGPAGASTVLVISSGTHGVEGFGGSGLQSALLHAGLGERLPKDTRLVLIHAINPFGFAWLRRFNEDNIDLNRNFVDHSKPYPKNPEYDKLADAIAPQDYSKEAVLKARGILFDYRREHGEDAIQAVITRGQFNHPRGLHFGGNAEAWSNRTIRRIIAEHGSGAARLVMIDIHTGLGKPGHAEIIMNDPVTSPAYKRALSWWAEWVKTTKGESVSADLYGTLKLAVDDMLPEAQVTAVSLEFGTSPPEEVFFAMHAENWLHNHADRSDPRWEPIKAKLRRAFYPDTTEWKRTIWGHAREIVDRLFEGLRRSR
jgi:hypothetical protein